jgi:hypothetical protein
LDRNGTALALTFRMAREPQRRSSDEPRVIVVLHRKGTCPWLQRIARQRNWPLCFHDATPSLLRRIFGGGRVIVVQVGPGTDDPIALHLLRLLRSHWTPLRVMAVDLSLDGSLESAVRRAGVSIRFVLTGRPADLVELVDQLLGCFGPPGSGSPDTTPGRADRLNPAFPSPPARQRR